MVLQQTRTVHGKAQPRLDFNRILGISSTLALNVLALLFLLMPMTLPGPVPLPVKDMQWEWIEPKPRPTQPPPVVPIEQKRTPAQPQPVRRVETQAPPIEQLVVPDGTEQATPPVVDIPTGDIAPPAADASGPVEGMALRYIDATAPPYPRAAITGGLEGVVLLRVLVDLDGKPVEVSIEKSSGHRVLDREAQRHVLRHWTFQPAMRDGQAVQAVGLVPIDFTLDRG